MARFSPASTSTRRSSHRGHLWAASLMVVFTFLANVDVDATGPGTSLGTDADGAPRTCGDLPALPGCIPRLVRSLDDAADRHQVPNERTLPKRPGGTSGIFRSTGKHHFVSRMAAAATPANPDGSYSLPHHPGAAHSSRGSRPQANRIKSPRSRGWRSLRSGTSHPLSLGNLAEAGSKPNRNDDDNRTTRHLSRQIAIS